MENEKGLSLYLALVVMSILLAIVLGISTILVSQLKILRDVENSVVAFYAAETGIEKALELRSDPTPLNNTGDMLSNGATYFIKVLISGEDACGASNYCIQSVGTYGNVKRALQVSY